MYPYAYRDPRIAAYTAVEFETGGELLLGWTRNLSERGLQADFREPLVVGSKGKVRVRIGHCSLELQAEVAHMEGFLAGLVFAFSSEQESSFVKAFVQVLLTA